MIPNKVAFMPLINAKHDIIPHTCLLLCQSVTPILYYNIYPKANPHTSNEGIGYNSLQLNKKSLVCQIKGLSGNVPNKPLIYFDISNNSLSFKFNYRHQALNLANVSWKHVLYILIRNLCNTFNQVMTSHIKIMPNIRQRMFKHIQVLSSIESSTPF